MLILALALMAGTAQAGHKSYSLTAGSGAQFHVGNGLPLPIQPVAIAPAGTGTSFPVLGIGLASGGPKTVMQTTAMGSQNKLTVPASVLSKAPAQKTLGLFVSNPLLYAVATNLGFKWPGAVAAVFSTAARTGPKTVKFITLLGNNIRYSNPLAKKFGGPARFLASAGAPAGLMPAVPATIFAVAVLGPLGNPPCTHTALTPVPFPGTFAKSLCLAALGQALPSLVTTGPMLGAHGGPVGLTLSTPGGTPAAVVGVPPPGPVPGLGIGKFGPVPVGTVSFFAFTGKTAGGFTNHATSHGYPWTTGMLTFSSPVAFPPEIFLITGKDSRTPGGAGVIQMVAGSLSQRTLSGPNGNRAWVQLVMAPLPDVPALSPPMRGVAVGLIVLAVVLAFARSQRSATRSL